MNIDNIAYTIQIAGTVAFAVAAVIAVAPRGIDIFGACVLGVITAAAGGTIRDLILGVPVCRTDARPAPAVPGFSP